MRTTLEIEDRVLDRAKRLAAKSGVTLGQLVSEALVSYTSIQARRADAPFHLIVAGDARARAPTPEEIFRAEEDEELQNLRIPGVSPNDHP
ncbi:MAG: DUF2191 domain-containing protein [Deltaproteobacteria bacterium]|nr:DUF2191 domain-containing protein [Deltaproteobacteria bacterium]